MISDFPGRAGGLLHLTSPPDHLQGPGAFSPELKEAALQTSFASDLFWLLSTIVTYIKILCIPSYIVGAAPSLGNG